MKYYVISDVHSHFDAMMTALRDAGFSETEENCRILLNGDAFTRGPQPVEVWTFLKRMHDAGKLIWIAGNHEHTLLNRLGGHIKDDHDMKTLRALGEYFSGRTGLSDEEVIKVCDEAGFTRFIQESIVPFHETEHYVFTHNTVPYSAKGGIYAVYPDWRERSFAGMQNKNGMHDCMVRGVRVPGKTLVVGHVKAAYGNLRKHLPSEQWDDPKLSSVKTEKDPELNKPYFGDGVIGMDGNATQTNTVNCLVIED